MSLTNPETNENFSLLSSALDTNSMGINIHRIAWPDRICLNNKVDVFQLTTVVNYKQEFTRIQ